ncbi:UNVERIFIED_CONTAM: protein POLYCHOME [Sesamum calycinum]|uniref:Protein POLYCHOME n=1 Tax=Sesamum calycinum TaxID=2727403 RepID=A0AAW2N4M8_9LAMI
MPEARDRLSRQDDIVAAYSRRRISSTGNRNTGRGSSIMFVLDDESEDGQVAGTPFRWRGAAMVGTPGPTGVTAGRGAIGTPRTGRAARIIGRENLSPLVGSGRGRGSGRGSALPTWYPRRPLNEITAVVRAIERRRERRRGGDGLQTESPILQDQTFHDPSVSTSGAQLEHDISMISPHPTILNRRCPPTIGKVPKILLNITHHNDGDSACLTPQKKLLDNIDTVEKVVMEELRKLKRTPSARKAEREKRVRTLMSMR